MFDDINISISWEEQKLCIIRPHRRPRPPRAVALKLALTTEEGITIRGDNMALTLTTVQRCSMQVAGADAHGNPAPLENVTYEGSDPAIITVEADAADPTKAMVTAAGQVGNAQVTCNADAKIGEGVSPLMAILDVTVVAAEAVSLQISTGTPEDAPVDETGGGEVPPFEPPAKPRK